jgi:hypothetical protein
MATRRPIVLVSGVSSELPPGDLVPGVDSTAQASGNAALVLAATALASGNLGVTNASIALASGNAALDKGIYTSEWTLGADGNNHYTFTGPGFSGGENDPLITLVRGQQYKFTNTMNMHPFRVQTTPNGSVGTQYNAGITNNDVSNGTLIWNIQFDAPNTLYYQCTSHTAMGGPFYIVDNGAISALASGNAALTNSATALASGNAALTGLSSKYDKVGGAISGPVVVQSQSIGPSTYVISSGVCILNFGAGNNFEVVLNAATSTFATPVNASGGQTGAITLRQDNTGTRLVAYSGAWSFASNTAPTLTTTASGVDLLAYYVVNPARILAVATLAYGSGTVS